jgi:hypothetical protein
LITLSQKVVREHGEAIEEWLPGIIFRKQDNSVAHTFEKDLGATKAILFGQANGLALAILENLGTIHKEPPGNEIDTPSIYYLD